MIHDLLVASVRPETVARNQTWVTGPWTNVNLRGGDDVLWAFSDGAGDGMHAAVLVTAKFRGKRSVRMFARSPDRPPKSRNVAAEVDGVRLAVEAASEESGASTLVVVSDFLWTAAYLKGIRKVKATDLKERVDSLEEAVRAAPFELTFVHHPGHQKGETLMIRYNAMADAICSGKPVQLDKKTERSWS